MGLYKVDKNTGDTTLVAGATMYADAPIGAILPYGGTTAPSGWLLCQGQAISRTDYADLFNTIGTAYGTGNGSTTFNIPDLRETIPVGVGENDTQIIANHDAYTLGEFKDDSLGKHDHPLTVTTRATYNTAGVPVGVDNNNTPTTATHGKQLGVNYIIKAKQISVPIDIVQGIANSMCYQNGVIENIKVLANSMKLVRINFDTPMPDAEYCVDIEPYNTLDAQCIPVGANERQTDHFNIIIRNISSTNVTNLKITWQAFRILH